MHEHKSNLLTPDEERFWKVDFIIREIGYRPLARKANLSAGHVHKILNGKGKNVVVATLKKISAAAQLSFEDLYFYVERQREYEQIASQVDAERPPGS
jgi:DNA-binding Xre family transcriptional regulator